MKFLLSFITLLALVANTTVYAFAFDTRTAKPLAPDEKAFSTIGEIGAVMRRQIGAADGFKSGLKRNQRAQSNPAVGIFRADHFWKTILKHLEKHAPRASR